METRRRKSDLQKNYTMSIDNTTNRIIKIVFADNNDQNNNEVDNSSNNNISNKRLKMSTDEQYEMSCDADDGPEFRAEDDVTTVFDDCLKIDTIKFCTDPNWLTEFLERESSSFTMLPLDHDVIFDKNSSVRSTKRAFCIDMQNAVAQNGMTFTQLNDVFEVLQRHTSSLKLPIIKPNPLNPININKQPPRLRHNMDKYTGKDNRTCVIDVCPNDCIAFHGGKTFNGVKYSELLFCPVCPAKRFSHCSHPDCKDKDYEFCNPFKQVINSRTLKPNQPHKRLPEKEIYYRPITAKLLQLYKLSLTEGNDGLLRYFQDKYRVSRQGMFDSLRCNNSRHEGCFLQTASLILMTEKKFADKWIKCRRFSGSFPPTTRTMIQLIKFISALY